MPISPQCEICRNRSAFVFLHTADGNEHVALCSTCAGANGLRDSVGIIPQVLMKKLKAKTIPLRVLFIDDEPYFAQHYVDALARDGLEVKFPDAHRVQIESARQTCGH